MRGWFRPRPPKVSPAPNPATTLSSLDIHAKTLHSLSTAEWLALTPQQRADARLGVVAAMNERIIAAVRNIA